MKTLGIIVAGQGVVAQLEAEQETRVPKTPGGFFKSEELCSWQRAVWARGYRDVELVESKYGWSVRSGTGLDNFALLASARFHQVDGTLEDAVRWAVHWCAGDPERRYAWRRVPAMQFLDPDTCFERAIAAGRLSRDEGAATWAGRFMYMGTVDGRDQFKAIDSREYLP